MKYIHTYILQMTSTCELDVKITDVQVSVQTHQKVMFELCVGVTFVCVVRCA